MTHDQHDTSEEKAPVAIRATNRNNNLTNIGWYFAFSWQISVPENLNDLE